MVQLLVHYGAGLDFADAAHWAVESGDCGMLEKVIERGVGVGKKDSFN